MKKEIDMINGKLFPEMLRFSLPLVLSGVLQVMYNAADSLIVGIYEGSNAVGAVGSVGPIINIMLNLFIGLSVGTNVLVARYWGGNNKKMVKKTSDTAIIIALIAGILVGVLGFFLAEFMAKLVKLDPEIIDMSILYMKIYFLGMPFAALYNLISSTMRGIGNTKGPMVCLIVSGMVNVIFNFIFVKFFGMGVAGVATATVISQIVSVVMIIYMLKKSPVGVNFKNITFDKNIFKNTVKIGVPAGIQGMVFSFSNTIIISAVNSFGAAAAAANTISGHIENTIYVALNAITQAVITFTSQNIGAKKPERINKIMLRGYIISATAGLAMSMVAYLLKDQFIELFAPGEADVKAFATIKYTYVVLPYFIISLMEIPAGMLRGMGATFISMLMSVIGVCGVRIVWILSVFPIFNTLESLYVSYPISWVGTSVAYLIAYIILKKRLDKSLI